MRSLMGGVSRLPNGIHEQVCGQIDPFCAASLGAKVASEASGALTGTIQEKLYYPITVDANGNYAAILNNGMQYAAASLTQAAGGAITAVNSYTSSNVYNSLGGANSTGEYRISSWGFTFNYTGSDYQNQGTKTAMQLPATSLAQLSTNIIGTTPLNLQTYFAESSVTRLPVPLAYVGRPQSQMAREEFVPVNPSDIQDSNSNPWGYVVLFAISGAQASTSVGFIEVVLNYEYQTSLYGVGTTNYASKFQNPIKGPPPVVADLAGRVRAGLNLFYENLPIEAVTSRIASATLDILSKGANKAYSRATSMLGM
jgi:hypothetical protein